MWAGNAALLGQTESTAVWGPPAGSPVRSALGEGVGVGRLQQIFCGRLGRENAGLRQNLQQEALPLPTRAYLGHTLVFLGFFFS